MQLQKEHVSWTHCILIINMFIMSYGDKRKDNNMLIDHYALQELCKINGISYVYCTNQTESIFPKLMKSNIPFKYVSEYKNYIRTFSGNYNFSGRTASISIRTSFNESCNILKINARVASSMEELSVITADNIFRSIYGKRQIIPNEEIDNVLSC